ncbi:MAG: GNAT family N-acetyltransferase [Adhaeribacter sp.]
MEKQIVRHFLPQGPSLAKGDTTEVLVGERVIQALTESSFQQDWDELYAACSWGTVFQSRAYVATWYGVYGLEYLPVIVRTFSAGRLEGLLTLAQEKSGRLVGAGAEQAEYQVWLSRNADQGSFIQNALVQMRQDFPGKEIKLKYIPGKTPMNWVKAQAIWRSRCFIRKHKHPLLEIKEEEITRELQKKNRREKMNRLKRMGELAFEKIIDEKVFASLFDHLADQFDFRKGAMYNKQPIHSALLRKKYFLDLFNKGILHVTVLKLNKEIIASNVGTKGKRWVHLQGMNTHAPQYARYSPGILHFLLLGKWLATEGFEIFDLSPGADSYKDSLATRYTHAYEFRCTSLLSCQTERIKNLFKRNFKDFIFQMGIKSEALKMVKTQIAYQKDKIRKVAKERWSRWGLLVWQQNHLQKKVRQLRLDPTSMIQSGQKNMILGRGSLKDLLQYDQRGEVETRWQFLKKAMNRLEAEYQPFTYTSEGRLLACVWLRPEHKIEGKEEIFILEGAYCHLSYKNRWEQFIHAVASEATLNKVTAQVYLTI